MATLLAPSASPQRSCLFTSLLTQKSPRTPICCERSWTPHVCVPPPVPMMPAWLWGHTDGHLIALVWLCPQPQKALEQTLTRSYKSWPKCHPRSSSSKTQKAPTLQSSPWFHWVYGSSMEWETGLSFPATTSVKRTWSSISSDVNTCSQMN